jgi:hypothetical protein
MKMIILAGLGVLIMLAGAIFTLQGFGVIGGSTMSGVTFWAVAGPVIAVAGLAITVVSLRAARLNSRITQPAAPATHPAAAALARQEPWTARDAVAGRIPSSSSSQ